jgi:TolB-like protein/thioredoxin-like negative regulator of GroEL
MPDIFLSYSREDNATATRFAEAFKRAGFTVWWDQALRSGETYDEVTERALREAKAVVVLWSRHSVQSRWVRSEAKIADRNGTFVPVMIEHCERPVMFELTQSTDLSRWKGDASDKAWRSLVDDVRRLAGQGGSPAAPAPGAGHALRFSRARAALLASVLSVAGLATWWLVAGGKWPAWLQAAEPVSIAVLPFVDLTPAGTDTPLAEGLAEEITNWLAQIPDLRVVSRTSAFKFKGANQDVRSVGKQLGATYVIEGSIRRGKNLVRVTVQMVSAADGYHKWSKTMDLPDGNDALRIEDTVSRAVAETLNARLSEDTERRWKARQANEPEAFGLYIQGRFELRQRTAESNLRAQELLRRAIVKDPRFTLAYASLVEATLNGVSLNGRDRTEAESEAGPLLDQALALSPDMPEVIAASGRLAMEQYRIDDAVILMQRALALNPSDTDTHRRMGVLYEQMGLPRQAVARYDVAAQLDPLEFMNHVYRCLGLQDLAQFAEAEAACARARALNASSVWGPMATAWLALGRGDLAAALQWMNRAAGIAPEDMSVQVQRVQILLALGRHDAAREVVAGLPASAEPARSFLDAAIAVALDDQVKLRALVEAIAMRDDLSADDWLDLARLQLNAGAVGSAKVSLDHAQHSDGYRPAELADPGYVRNGFSAAVIVAGVEMAAGNRDAALQALRPLDEVLDRMEKDGAACSGLYSLRAESLALRGEPERALVALNQAYGQGWRLSRSARSNPFLRTLQQREDFKALLARVDQQLRSIDVDARALPP